jgi:hypothetical protein
VVLQSWPEFEQKAQAYTACSGFIMPVDDHVKHESAV